MLKDLKICHFSNNTFFPLFGGNREKVGGGGEVEGALSCLDGVGHLEEQRQRTELTETVGGWGSMVGGAAKVWGYLTKGFPLSNSSDDGSGGGASF